MVIAPTISQDILLVAFISLVLSPSLETISRTVILTLTIPMILHIKIINLYIDLNKFSDVRLGNACTCFVASGFANMSDR